MEEENLLLDTPKFQVLSVDDVEQQPLTQEEVPTFPPKLQPPAGRFTTDLQNNTAYDAIVDDPRAIELAMMSVGLECNNKNNASQPTEQPQPAVREMTPSQPLPYDANVLEEGATNTKVERATLSTAPDSLQHDPPSVLVPSDAPEDIVVETSESFVGDVIDGGMEPLVVEETTTKTTSAAAIKNSESVCGNDETLALKASVATKADAAILTDTDNPLLDVTAVVNQTTTTGDHDPPKSISKTVDTHSNTVNNNNKDTLNDEENGELSTTNGNNNMESMTAVTADESTTTTTESPLECVSTSSVSNKIADVVQPPVEGSAEEERPEPVALESPHSLSLYAPDNETSKRSVIEETETLGEAGSNAVEQTMAAVAKTETPVDTSVPDDDESVPVDANSTVTVEPSPKADKTVNNVSEKKSAPELDGVDVLAVTEQQSNQKNIEPSIQKKPSFADMAKKARGDDTVASALMPSSSQKETKRVMAPPLVKSGSAHVNKAAHQFVPSLSAVVSTQQQSESANKPGQDNGSNNAPHVVVLVSGKTNLHKTIAQQQRVALECLTSNKIPHRVVNETNKAKSKRLFQLSGSFGEYPQFFHVDQEGITTSWGGFDRLELANKSGALSNGVALFAPGFSNAAMSATKCIVLVSNQSLGREVFSRQERAFSILHAEKIPYETLDGAESKNKQARENLFTVSGLPGEYPQFFVHQNDALEFWGTFDQLVEHHDAGTLSSSMMLPIGTTAVARAASETETIATTREGTTLSNEPASSTSNVPPASEKDEKASDNTTGSQGQSSNKGSGSEQSSKKVKFDKQSKANRATSASDSSVETEITIYGATSFVAKHALDYLMQTSLWLPGARTITLAGRNESKLKKLEATVKMKMTNLRTVNTESKGMCTFDTFVADSSDALGLKTMAKRTKVVMNFAGPYMTYSENVVAACAQTGTSYVDITGEVGWASAMRQKYSDVAKNTNARIISFSGYDSIPSDLSIYCAVQALKEKTNRPNIEIESGVTWHYSLGGANGGTVKTMVEMPIDLKKCLSQPVPFFMDDPLALAYPRVKVDPNMQLTKNRMAKSEWLNQFPSLETIVSLGFSAPFFMAVTNSKVVQASAVALNYGPSFTYRERFFPLGFMGTKGMGIVSFFPALMFQFGVMVMFIVMKLPVLGTFLVNLFMPPGTGMSDHLCKSGVAEVYAEVSTPANAGGFVDRANCSIKFKGDPCNYVTAQCVCESALALILDQKKLPPRSADGFGTPAELLGSALLQRLKDTKVRPVEIAAFARQNVKDSVLIH